MTESPIKYFAYVRKSSEDKEKQALSIPAQKDKIKERFPDLDIEFIEEEKSAFIPYNRPKFDDMLKRVRKGERRGLIGWHPDRLSRNEVDASSITYMLRTGEIQDLKLCTYYFENTPEGIWMLQIALSQSQYESAKKGRDVKRGLEKKAETGEYPGPAPTGYLNDKYEERGHKKVYTDKKRRPMLRRMVDLMLTGNYTPPRIRKIANEEWGYKGPNGKGISRSGIYNLFSRTFYYGWYEYPVGSGKWHKGNHEPLYTREEYDRMQLLLGRKGNPRPQTREFTYRGPIKCGECGGAVTAEIKRHCVCTKCKHKFSCLHKTACTKCGTDISEMKSPTIREFKLYHCAKSKDPSCKQGSISEAELENQVQAELKRFQVPGAFTDWALQVLKRRNASEITKREAVISNQRKEYDAVLAKIDGLIDMRANKELDAEEFRRRKEMALKEKARLSQKLAEADQRVENWLEIAERGFDFAENARARFAEDDSEDLHVRKEIFANLGSNYVLKDKKLSVEADNLLLAIKNVHARFEIDKITFEPAENGSVAIQIKGDYVLSEPMLPD